MFDMMSLDSHREVRRWENSDTNTQNAGSHLGNLGIECSYADGSCLVDNANLAAQCRDLPGDSSHRSCCAFGRLVHYAQLGPQPGHLHNFETSKYSQTQVLNAERK